MRNLLLFLIFSGFFIDAASSTGNTETEFIQFAGSGGYPPFNYINEENEIVGFDVDVAGELAKRLGMKLDYVTTPWEGIIRALLSGRFRGILGSMAVTGERKEILDFSIPYYYSGAQIVVRKGSAVQMETIGPDTVVGVCAGTTFINDAEALGAQVRLYEDDNQTLKELMNNRIDAVITDRIVAMNAAQKNGEGAFLVLEGGLLRTENIAVAFRKKDPILDDINRFLMEMHEDGTLSALSKKWFDGIDISNP